MNMHPHEPLLDDLLSDGTDGAAESVSLETLLSDARRVRRQRRLIRYGLGPVLAVLVLAQIALSLNHPRRLATASQSTAASAPLPHSPPAAPAPIRTISDEELFALFPDRQLALIGPPGDQRLLFLDGR
jgi:hypothetical protein